MKECSNHRVKNVNELVSQNGIVHYIHEIYLWKDLLEISLEYAIGYENSFHKVQHVNVALVEYYGQWQINVQHWQRDAQHWQRNVLGCTSFREYLVKIFADEL